MGQPLVDKSSLLIAHHKLPSSIVHHQLRPHGSLTALLQGHLQAEDAFTGQAEALAFSQSADDNYQTLFMEHADS